MEVRSEVVKNEEILRGMIAGCGDVCGTLASAKMVGGCNGGRDGWGGHTFDAVMIDMDCSGLSDQVAEQKGGD